MFSCQHDRIACRDPETDTFAVDGKTGFRFRVKAAIRQQIKGAGCRYPQFYGTCSIQWYETPSQYINSVAIPERQKNPDLELPLWLLGQFLGE